MAEISVRLPIGLSFDLVDYDSVLPSLNARINIDLTARSLFAVQLKLNSVWFFCSVWDQFIDDLLANRTAILADMDQALTVKVTSEPENLTLVITFQEGALNDYSTDIQLTAKLDHDSIFILKEQFKNVPKWW